MINSKLSKRIISLRFLLIIFVVLIHNNITEIKFSGSNLLIERSKYVEVVINLFSNIIARVAVPLFFLISGYLLYLKESKFSSVLRKKTKTILLPYLIWNILVVIFFFTAQSFSFTKLYFANPQNIIRNFGFIDWIDIFVGKFTERAPYPIVYQFWFLRDLFILNLLFLIIKKAVDIFPIGILVLSLVLWLSGINIYIVSTEALLFFTLGYYIVKFSLDIKSIDSIKIIDISVIYLITIIVELFFPKSFVIIHNVNIIMGSVFFIKLTYYFVQNEKVYNVLAWLEGFAFFVYAFHEPTLTIFKKLSVRIIPMHDSLILLQYFGVAILGISISLILGVFLKKTFPKIYAVLTGGRT